MKSKFQNIEKFTFGSNDLSYMNRWFQDSLIWWPMNHVFSFQFMRTQGRRFIYMLLKQIIQVDCWRYQHLRFLTFLNVNCSDYQDHMTTRASPQHTANRPNLQAALNFLVTRAIIKTATEFENLFLSKNLRVVVLINRNNWPWFLSEPWLPDTWVSWSVLNFCVRLRHEPWTLCATQQFKLFKSLWHVGLGGAWKRRNESIERTNVHDSRCTTDFLWPVDAECRIFCSHEQYSGCTAERGPYKGTWRYCCIFII